MDENNPQTISPAPTTPSSADGGGSGNKMAWIIGSLVVLILIAAGVFYYTSSKQQEALQPSPSPKPAENLESELNKIQVEDVNREFSEVDKDLETL